MGLGRRNTVVYLTFDPSDSLSAASSAHRPGKFNGIPCKVPDVERKEKNWYLVQFYTNERWGQINVLNCSGGGG